MIVDKLLLFMNEVHHRVKHYGTVKTVKYEPSIKDIHGEHPKLKSKYKKNAKPEVKVDK